MSCACRRTDSCKELAAVRQTTGCRGLPPRSSCGDVSVKALNVLEQGRARGRGTSLGANASVCRACVRGLVAMHACLFAFWHCSQSRPSETLKRHHSAKSRDEPRCGICFFLRYHSPGQTSARGEAVRNYRTRGGKFKRIYSTLNK